jgi:3-oxoacyl-[acyl-carrier-protein] synthase II
VPRKVVITGVGSVTPFGTGVRAFIDGWCAGTPAITEGEGRCVGFDASRHLSRKESHRADRFVHFVVVAADEAVSQAGWDDGLSVERERIGSIVGAGFGGVNTSDAQHEILRTEGWRRVNPLTVPKIMGNAPAAALSLRYGLGGPSFQTGAACAAGASAVANAFRLIRGGEIDACLAGGTEASLTDFSRASFKIMGAISPSGCSRPFDARRDGFVLGEGAGVLALEAEEVARARGATILAEIGGIGETSDSYHLTSPDPKANAAARAIGQSLKMAGLTPEDVDYVNAHGTSTPLNDAAETVALKRALGEERARAVPTSSAKSAIGHLVGAAGAVEAVALVASLHEKVAPPTLGYEEPDPACDLDYVFEGPRSLQPKDGRLVGLSNSFGFGGHNSVLCMVARA